MNRQMYFFILLLSINTISTATEPVKKEKKSIKKEKAVTAPDLSISANSAAVDITTGTGALGRWLGVKESSGVTLGGMLIGDVNFLAHGGMRSPRPKRVSADGLLILSLNIDMYKATGVEGGSIGLDFLQFNAQNVNGYAGSAQGYNSLPGPYPLNRSELYQLWYRQTFLDEKLILRFGKTVPTYDFNNVIRPVMTQDKSLAIPAVTGLLFTPIFVNSSILGVLPGYYNSAYGVTATALPFENTYLSYGLYDGNLARGVQTGIKPMPTINSYRFNIVEGGQSWKLGSQNKPGMFALGGWWQTGLLSTGTGITEKGAQGFYLFGSQRLWLKNCGVDNSGISMFYQFGVNNSKTLPFPKYLGLGATGFSLIPNRPEDSMGIGMALAWLNSALFTRKRELMFQSYYQMYLIKNSYFVGALTYIPTPGIPNSKPNAIALTARLIVLF